MRLQQLSERWWQFAARLAKVVEECDPLCRTWPALLGALLLAAPAARGQFTFAANGSALAVTGYSGPGGDVSIPATNNGLRVTSIAEGAFASLTNLTNVVIPGTVTNIGEEAFLECSCLTNVTIPVSVTSIGEDAFADCASLAGVTIPGSVSSLGFDAFAGCIGLASLTIGNGVPNIGEDAFYYCTSLTSVMIPGSVTNLEEDAFAWCTGLSGVYFAGNPPAADSSVFYMDSGAAVYYFTDTNRWSAALGGVPALLWNPLIQTGDASFGVQTNQFGFNITGTANIPIVVEACTNLGNPVWAPLQTNTLTNGLFYFSEPVQTNLAGRFYRLSTP